MSTSTRAYYGASCDGASETGSAGGVAPLFDGAFNGRGDYISDLSTCKARGARVLLRFYGSASNVRDGNSAFSVAMWKDEFDAFAAKAPAAQIRNFWTDGTLLALYAFDDISPGSTVFSGGIPTFAEIEECCAYAKSTLTFLPLCAREMNQNLRDYCVDAGASHYTYLDFGWAQWHRKQGGVQTWFTNHVNSGRQVKLGAMLGMNLLNGGSGLTSPWDVHPDLPSPQFGMSPQEIDACAQAFSQQTYAIGFNVWAQNAQFDETDYWHYTGIQAAMQGITDVAVGREMGPINWRDISGGTSGSSQTVAGNWQFLGRNRYRANNPATINVTLPADIPASGVIGIIAYSRDSGRSSVAPSGWSTAQRISGTSAQGGDLALFYRIATGSEGGTQESVDFTGSAGNTACQCISFAFSGNSLGQPTVLSKAGSARSWAAASNMGPVPGLQSTTSDALVIVIAAKTNDFNNGDPVPDATMSATTSDGETWNRMHLSTNVSGDDSGILIDYALTSGLPSITTKSWTQVTGSGSSSSGAGCGFMVAFAPFAIVAGQPPVIQSNLEDVTLSLGSTFSTTFVSSGSTPITWSKVSGPSNATLGSSTGQLTFTPSELGTYFLIIRATNSHGSDTGSFSILMTSAGGPASNNAPVITHPGDFTVAAQQLVAFGLSATDADNDQLTYTLGAGAPSGALMDPSTGQFIWVPSGEQGPGTYPIVAVVDDGTDASRSTFTITVTDVPWTKQVRGSPGFTQPSSGGNSFTRI